jgi:class 3 adenylate cyclase
VTGGGAAEAPRVLGPTSRAPRPFPRYAPWLTLPVVLAFVAGRFAGPIVPPSAVLLTFLVGAVGAIAAGGWCEDEMFRRMQRWPLPWRVAGALTLPAGLLVTASGVALLLGLILRPVGLGAPVSGLVLVAGAWAASAAVGSLLVASLDAAATFLVRDFRSRILMAVMGLMAVSAALSWHALAVVVQLVTRLERGEYLGELSFVMPGQEAIEGPAAELFADNPLGLAGGVFFAGLLLLVPAALSVAGKLADSVMARIHPLTEAFEAVGTGARDVRLEEAGSTELERMAERFNRMVTDLELAERLERAFGVYVSPQVMARIKARHGEARIPPELRNATVLFLDIRGFTALSERLPPGTVASVLNRYFEAVVTVVDAHEGYLDKFIGDAVIAVWNGPVDQPDHATQAVRCAFALQQATSEMNAAGAFPEAGALGVGIGIATGQVFCGNVGGSGQMEYTVIGDTVNLAARLTGHAPAGEVWVSPQTADALPEALGGEILEPIALKGKKAPVRPLRMWPRDSVADGRASSEGAG